MRWILLKALILVLSSEQVLIIVDDECDISCSGDTIDVSWCLFYLNLSYLDCCVYSLQLNDINVLYKQATFQHSYYWDETYSY